MGLTHSPKIVTEGLVLCVDAASSRSRGSDWVNLIPGTGYDGTLINGASFDTPNSIDLDGTNDYINFGDTPFVEDTDCTISFAAKINSTGSDQDFVTKGNHSSTQPFTVWYDAAAGSNPSVGANNTHCLTVIVRGDDNDARIWISGPTDSIAAGEICMFDIVVDVTNTKVVCYKNGSLLVESGANSDFTGIKGTTSTLRLGVDSSQVKDLNGSFYYFRVYDRTLAASEIKQNYEATKGRLL